MSILDRIFIGTVVKDFGIVEEKTYGIGRMRKSALLAQRDGKFYFVIKMSAVAILGASVNYTKFELEDAYKIREYINQSEAILKHPPYFEKFAASGISKSLPLSNIIIAVITFLVGVLIIWWLNSSIFILLATLVFFVTQVNAYQDFHRFEQAEGWQKVLPAVLAFSTLIVGIGKAFLGNYF